MNPATGNSPLVNPAPWQTLPAMLEDCCQQYGEQLAIIDGDRNISYTELHELVTRCAKGLHALGLKQGEPVLLWSQNSWQWIVLAFASWQLGAVVVPVSTRFKAREVTPILQRSGSRWLFASVDCLGEDLLQCLDEQSLSTLEHIVTLHGESCLANAVAFEQLPAEDEAKGRDTAPEINGDSLCQVLFTSGTTGQPKGVMLGGRQLLQSYWDWSDLGGLRSGDRFLVVPPFSHGFGINAGIVACVMRGMTHVVVDFFDPTNVLSQIREHQISVMSGAPALFSALARQLQQSAADAPHSLRVAYIGAAHVPVDIISTMQNTLGIERVINAYGLIEGCVVSLTRAADPIEKISTTVGKALPNVEVRICDNDDKVLPVGETGEIQLHSYGIMQGYFGEKALTEQAITASGWLRTGDIGSIDAQGYISIQGRKKDMYICNGFNVYPAEVEDLLRQNDAVSDCAIIGTADDKLGEAGIAFVVPGNTSANNKQENTIRTDNTAEESLKSWAKANMATYKVPRAFYFIDTLPLNANGKVQKDILREQWQHNQAVASE